MNSMNMLVLGLGNTILRDDGVGIYVARALRERVGCLAAVEEAELAGLDLIERLNGYDRAIIIDAIQLEDEEPGTVFKMRPDDIRITARLASVHDVDLVTALELGRRLRFKMPDDVVIFAVQALDTRTLGEGCTEAVERVIGPLVEEIVGVLSGAPHEPISISLADRRKGRA
jgi:hydrogenase maturation protease